MSCCACFFIFEEAVKFAKEILYYLTFVALKWRQSSIAWNDLNATLCKGRLVRGYKLNFSARAWA